MPDSSSNITNNSIEGKDCLVRATFTLGLSIISIITLLMGQPVTAILLWISVTSKKTIDILNCNLALFHNLQYIITIFQFIVLVMQSTTHQCALRILFVYLETGGPLSLSLICLERYIAVIHPTSYPLLKTYRCREVCVAIFWLFSLSVTFVTVFTVEGSNLADSVTTINLPLVVLLFVLTMTVWCSRRIARALKKSSPGTDKLHPVKSRAFKIVCTTATITAVCYIPVAVLQKNQSTSPVTFKCVSIPISILLLSIASIVHPLLYITTHGKLFTCLKVH